MPSRLRTARPPSWPRRMAMSGETTPSIADASSGNSSRWGPRRQAMSTSSASRVRLLGTIAMSSNPYARRAFLPRPISISNRNNPLEKQTRPCWAAEGNHVAVPNVQCSRESTNPAGRARSPALGSGEEAACGLPERRIRESPFVPAAVPPHHPPMGSRPEHRDARVELVWLPLGAGGHSVRLNGLAYEALAAGLARRPRRDLYHAALRVDVDGVRWAVEQAPAGRGDPGARGVVVTGPVGARWTGRLRAFRYEIRRWPEGVIPDMDQAVGGPLLLSGDPETARRLLDAGPHVPALAWGRDARGTGEVWNSNCVVLWLRVPPGIPTPAVPPPPTGRGP